jgi:hypothetical protein
MAAARTHIWHLTSPAAVGLPRLPACCLQLLVCSKTVGPIAPVTVRLEVTHVKLRGRLRLGVQLGQDAPGIQ